ncbi:hypothetical protein [Aeromicrobium sp. IC_218]|uniref:hypothetical protein n=1 Tax=Aeromicrobium sp. IC_218 TaxID=2545468 RepID=UPI00104095FD|nr:hypothetical protein [Aeromicrobium sp. IC_218]TCJ00783.1 hypothetical protein E0W78_01480 [Aeromicrobium sp. IC_218]
MPMDRDYRGDDVPAAVTEVDAGRRSVWRVALLGALALAAVSAGVAASRDQMSEDTADGWVLGILLIVLLVHLWASRWRWWMSVPLTLPPAVPLIVGAVDDTDLGTSCAVVAVGAMVASGTLALCAAAANRWGPVEGSRLDAFWHL